MILSWGLNKSKQSGDPDRSVGRINPELAERITLRQLADRDPQMEALTKKKPCPAKAGLRPFFFLPFPEASFRRVIKKKALLLSQQGLFFVAEGGFEPPTFGL